MSIRPTRLFAVVGVILLATGFAVIALAWSKAGEQKLEVGQLPYLLSGGFGGLGLIVAGAAGMVVDAIRRSGSSAVEVQPEPLDLTPLHEAADSLRVSSRRLSEAAEKLVQAASEAEEARATKPATRPRRRTTRSP